jgi:excisionase family DNA binding protein
MNNPFEVIEARLSNIETLLLDIKHQPAKVETTEQSEQFNKTVHEAADFLHLTIPTIYSKVSKGELPYMKRGKRLYFSITELMEYIKEGRKKSNAEIEQEAEVFLPNKKKS